MATVTRTTTWSSGDTLTAAALNAEFNNLLNALALGDSDISGGIAASKITGTAVTLAGTQTLTNKTISGADNTISGITESMLSTSDNTTLDVSTTKHGFVPKAPNDTTKFLRGDGTWAVAGSGAVLARVYRNSSGQTINNTTATKIQMNGESYDPSSLFDSSTNYRFLPTTSGYYVVTLNVQMVLASSGDLLKAMIYKNGAQYSHNENSLDSGRTTTCNCSVTDIIHLNGSTDYIEFYTQQNSGDTRSLTNGETVTFASMALL